MSPLLIVKLYVFINLVDFCFSSINKYTFKRLTFDIGAGKDFCLYEDFEKPAYFYLDFQVVNHHKIDVWLETKNLTIKKFYQSTGNRTVLSLHDGTYAFCFGNKHSKFAPITVALSLEPANHEMYHKVNKNRNGTIRPMVGPYGAFETSCEQIHSSLHRVAEFQFKFRAKMETDAKVAGGLNAKTTWLSFISTVGIFAVGLGRTVVLRKMFKTTIL